MGRIRRTPAIDIVIPPIPRRLVMFKKPAVKLTAEEERKQRMLEARKHYNQVSQSKSKKPESSKPVHHGSRIPQRKNAPSKEPQFTEFRKPMNTTKDVDELFRTKLPAARSERFQSLLPKQLSSSKWDSEFRRPTGKPKEDDALFKTQKFATPRTDRHQSLLPKELANLKLDGDYAAMFREINSARKIAAEKKKMKVDCDIDETPAKTVEFEVRNTDIQWTEERVPLVGHPSILKSSNRVRTNHVRFAQETIKEETPELSNAGTPEDRIANAVKTLSLSESELTEVLKQLSKTNLERLRTAISKVGIDEAPCTAKTDNKENVETKLSSETPRRASQQSISPAVLFADQEVKQINSRPKERIFDINRPENPIAKAIHPYSTSTVFCPIKSPTFGSTPVSEGPKSESD